MARQPRHLLDDSEQDTQARTASLTARRDQWVLADLAPYGRCLDAMLLTGLWTNEVIGARRREINLDDGLWTVPA
jgi:hypothetical protein